MAAASRSTATQRFQSATTPAKGRAAGIRQWNTGRGLIFCSHSRCRTRSGASVDSSGRRSSSR